MVSCVGEARAQRVPFVGGTLGVQPAGDPPRRPAPGAQRAGKGCAGQRTGALIQSVGGLMRTLIVVAALPCAAMCA